MTKNNLCDLCGKWPAKMNAIRDGDMLKICYPCLKYEDVIVTGKFGVNINKYGGAGGKIDFKSKDLTIGDLARGRMNGNK